MNINGLLLVDKPKNITSNQTLKSLKKILNVKKAGIVGILDPLAHGMLPILFGEATKFSHYIESYQKEYVVNCKLGEISSTGDREGVIKKYKDNNLEEIPIEIIKKALKKFVGQLSQIPPMFSGLKVRGQKLYKLARKGITISREPRKVSIYNIEIIKYQYPTLIIKVTCSKGTYIRTLAEEIGKELSIGAYVWDLRRTKIGKFEETDMIKFEKINNESIISSDYFLNINNILSEFDSFIVTEKEEEKIRVGQSVFRFSVLNNRQITIFNKNNIIGIGVIRNNQICPKRLLNFNE
ncbi:MAG: tRNA pseudouridine(55) synthase TruB [Pseudomonadota bacterium]|nr:tRNA pseudouridine(55) synthase TruB [Pseudomonadota bacterium]